MTSLHRLHNLTRELYLAHTGVGFGVIASSKLGIVPTVGGWVELARASSAALPNVTSIPDKRYYMFLNFQESNASNAIPSAQFNGDTGTNYADRREPDGGGDTTEVSKNDLRLFTDSPGGSVTVPYFTYGYISNLSAKEKLMIAWGAIARTGSGAGNIPARMEKTSKWVNTSSVINRMQMLNINAGTFNTNGELVILGWDPADTHTDNFWEELASVDLGSAATTITSGTITAKKYLWVQIWANIAVGSTTRLRFNSDSASNYSSRRSEDGAADATRINQNGILDTINSSAVPTLVNLLIMNNSAQEKLVTYQNVHQNTAGASNAPARIQGLGKWANTSAQITEISWTSDAANDFGIGSLMKVWGSD